MSILSDEEVTLAVQRGAARGLKAVLQARHPHLSFEMIIPAERGKGSTGSTGAAEPGGLVAGEDDSDALADGGPVPGTPAKPHDRERAA